MRATSPHLGAGMAAVALAAAVWSGSGLAASDPPNEPAPSPPAESPTSQEPVQPAVQPPASPAAEPGGAPVKRPSIIKADPPKPAPPPDAAAPPAEPEPATPEAAAPAAKPEPENTEPVETEITLKDKRRIVGVLISKTDEGVTISVGGVPTTFKMFSVDAIRTLPPVEEQYRALRASIDDTDAEGLTRLAEWLRVHRRLDEALVEVDRALRAEPTNPEARQLKVIITEQRKLEAARKPKSVPGKTAEPVKEARPSPTPFPLLNEEQINLIRVYEVDLTRPPKILITRPVIDEFIDKYSGTRVEGLGTIPNVPEQRAIFARQAPTKILEYMFALRAREFYGKVTVQENPRAMQLFIDNVNRSWLTNSCATSRCHGGEEAGRLWLYDKKPMSVVASYTNFYILEKFKTADGVPMIDYGQPGESPLLQMGLPREQAKFKHPDVGGGSRPRWKPTFRGPDDEKFLATVEWIRAMYPKRTEYPIDYTPPVPRGAPNGQDGAKEVGPR